MTLTFKVKDRRYITASSIGCNILVSSSSSEKYIQLIKLQMQNLQIHVVLLQLNALCCVALCALDNYTCWTSRGQQILDNHIELNQRSPAHDCASQQILLLLQSLTSCLAFFIFYQSTELHPTIYEPKVLSASQVWLNGLIKDRPLIGFTIPASPFKCHKTPSWHSNNCMFH